MPSVIKCIVKGKDIESVLLALEPFVLEPPVVQVITEKATTPAKKVLNGSITQGILDFVDTMANEGEKTVRTKMLKQFCVSIGASPSSYSYALKQLLDKKKLKRTSQPTTYEIVK